MKTFSMTHVGQRRETNQDYMYTSETSVGRLPDLFLVADGMGGHAAGDYASRFTVEKIVEYVTESEESEPVTVLGEAVRYANEHLLAEANADASKAGMGTTIVAAVVVGDKLYTANVGDSRLYVINQERITQITRDHSLVEEMVRLGEMDKEDAKVHPDKNIITRAVGASENAKVDFFEVDLERGDQILMCSDGLSNMVEDDMLFDIVKNTYIGDVVDELIDEAKHNGGLDNIAVIVIDPFDVEVN